MAEQPISGDREKNPTPLPITTPSTAPVLRPTAPSFTPQPLSKPLPQQPQIAARGFPGGRGSYPRPPSSRSSHQSASSFNNARPPRQSSSPAPQQPAVPRGYIPSITKPVRKDDSELDARIVAARLKAEEAKKKYELAEEERIAYEAQVKREETEARLAQEAREKAQNEMESYREAARQRKLKSSAEWDSGKEGRDRERERESVSEDRSYRSSINGDRNGTETTSERLERLRRELALKDAAKQARKEAAKLAELAELERRLAEHDMDSEDEAPALASRPYQASQSKPSLKTFERRRGGEMDYSPGYGTDRHAPRPHQDLPPEEERITEAGSKHRIYPAPAPKAEPLNVDQGWSGDDSSGPTRCSEDDVKVVIEEPKARYSFGSPTKQSSNGQYQDNTRTPEKGDYDDQSGFQTPALEKEDSPKASHLREKSAPSPILATPVLSSGSFIPWEPVKYKDESLNQPNPISREELMEGFGSMRQKDDAKPRGDGSGGGRNTDNGYGNRGPRRSDASGGNDTWGSGGDSGATGWGNEGDNKQSSTGWDNVGDGGIGGYGATGGGDDGCRICRETGHMARECPKKDSCLNCGESGHKRAECDKGPKCRRCQEFGHMSSDCSMPHQGGGGGGGGGGNCFNCGEDGHFSRECTNPRQSGGGGGGGGACYNCGEPGHVSRDCSQPQDPSKFRGTCDECGERGHRRRECPSSGGAGGGSGGLGINFGGGGGGYGGGRDGYGGGDGGNGYDRKQDDGYSARKSSGGGGDWGSSTSEDKPSGDRGASSASNKAKDDGWGSGAQDNSEQDDNWGQSGNGNSNDYDSGRKTPVPAPAPARSFMNPARMAAAGMPAELSTIRRGQSETSQHGSEYGGGNRSRGDDRGQEKSRGGGEYGGGGRYGQEDRGRGGPVDNGYASRRPSAQAPPRSPTPPPRERTPRPRERAPTPVPAANDEFGGW